MSSGNHAIIDDPQYAALFTQEVHELARRIFGALPAADALCRAERMIAQPAAAALSVVT